MLRKLVLLIAAAAVMSMFGPSTEASAHHYRYRPVVVSVVHRVAVPVERVVWKPVVVRTYAVRYYRTYAVRYARVYHRDCCCRHTWGWGYTGWGYTGWGYTGWRYAGWRWWW
jgi:hypothetical protein